MAMLQGIWPRIEDVLDGGALVTVTEQSIRTKATCIMPDRCFGHCATGPKLIGMLLLRLRWST
jgi:hypothetical protein